MAVYDPVFTPEDVLLFQQLQINTLTENRARCFSLSSPFPRAHATQLVYASHFPCLVSSLTQQDGEHTLFTPTICFMPHCDIELYENILKANWSRDRLSNLFLLGNRLATYVES